jgi:hypothetical protein
MGLWPTQGDEKRLLFSNYSLETPPSLCHPDRSAAQWSAVFAKYRFVTVHPSRQPSEK